MNCYGAKDLAASFRTVRKNTIKIAEDIGEEHYGFRAAPDTRTVAQTLVHIAGVPELAYQIHGLERRTTMEGFDFAGFMAKRMADENAAHTKEQILARLRSGGDQFAGWLDGLSEEFLGQQVSFPAAMQQPPKSRFEMILGIKEHEMHHRGQLMLIERMVGIVPHLTRDMQARIAAMQAGTATATAR
jgi:uncharacterized damage-inducible protein DinB